ncbi:hypothetical protein CORC01_10562 [Colletotrichum orchidophilum]|uniref:Small nuclear ribonucleoprotein Prp3 C-terminal domain-containing protein n=1 Tax=Colletotrichum orchidophilum TaxID=1209926 RepID=A0A1G4AYC2_9PEZI|nr:uncharacterized protein CORC01_10562 [Colletotrichum orchidophilum]OHE94105.1 hypothetical protein CORC01_10562 [Colletotrichum orchidophilum]
MAAAATSWHLLPPDLIEHQIGQIDLLTAMYPTKDEVFIDKDSEEALQRLKAHVEEDSSTTPFSRTPTVTLLLTLTIPEPEEDPSPPPSLSSPKTLQLDISVPFSYKIENNAPPPEEAPRIKVRIRQPSWLNRAATTHLNSQIPDGDEDLFSIIESINEEAVTYLKEAKTAEADSVVSAAGSEAGPLVRVWFYFPSISTRSKRDDFIINAPGYHLTGFLYAGKPGLLCLEGGSQSIDDYMKFIKTESWGDIPAHHKKVTERHREKDIKTRVFADMQEITDSVGERRGQRANRGDMKAVEGWLLERGLGDAFAKVLM